MTKYEGQHLLKETKDIVGQCDRCGTCLPVCPLFGVKDIESSSARGKNNIARAMVEGGIQPDSQVMDVVNFCLLCRTCISNCPNKVRTDEVMTNIRQYITDKKGSPGLKYRVLGKVLKDKTLLKLSAGALNLINKLKLNRAVPYGMAPGRFTREEYLKNFAGPAVLSGVSLQAKKDITKEMKVAYFRGCGMEMFFPEAISDSLKVLNSIAEVELVDNLCCGLPHLSHGLRKDFFEMAKKNILLYKHIDIVVSDCASCSGTLKHIGSYFKDDHEWNSEADAFSKKVMSFSEFLVKAGYQPQRRNQAKLTFHEPCHLGRGQGIKKEPRQLLKLAGEYVEMAGSDVCCGGAGSFHIDYPQTADAILEKKRLNIEKSEANIVVTECPVCLVQLSKAAQRSGEKFQAMHISQVV
ncbi:MAG: (Fe-S)-binding protein [Bacillota bacterium]